MLEFLENNYFIPFYAITLAISLFKYRWYYDSILKYFPMILAYTLLNEILGFLIFNFETFQIVYLEKYHFANNIIFNIYEVVIFLYFYRVYRKSINGDLYKKIITYGAALYIAASLINPFFQNVVLFPQIPASTMGSVILIIAIMLYLDESAKRTKKNNYLLIWVSIGLLIFNLIYPIIMLTGLLNFEAYQEFNFRKLHHILIVVMHSCFIIGFSRMKGRFLP